MDLIFYSRVANVVSNFIYQILVLVSFKNVSFFYEGVVSIFQGGGSIPWKKLGAEPAEPCNW